jgi:ribonuclease P/MRP protein subunit POP7
MKRKRRRGGGGDDGTEDGGGGTEEVVIKGTGKAIGKVLELGCWFQQRGEVYDVKIRTGTAKAVDDIEYDEQDEEADKMDVDGGDDMPEARIRQISVLEVYVSLR